MITLWSTSQIHGTKLLFRPLLTLDLKYIICYNYTLIHLFSFRQVKVLARYLGRSIALSRFCFVEFNGICIMSRHLTYSLLWQYIYTIKFVKLNYLLVFNAMHYHLSESHVDHDSHYFYFLFFQKIRLYICMDFLKISRCTWRKHIFECGLHRNIHLLCHIKILF